MGRARLPRPVNNRNRGEMNRNELRRRAAELGVAVSYVNDRGHEMTTPDQTLAAILGILHDAPLPGETPPVPAGLVAPKPAGRRWGFAVQLYSVRSRDSWGHGDLHDLAELAAWSGCALGAGFVLINPLHAPEPRPPVSDSPYRPMSRRFLSPLYLRIEDIEEFQALGPAERAAVDALSAPLRAANLTPKLIDRDAVWTAKRSALETIYRVPRRAGRQAALDAFRCERGAALKDWGTWCALADRYGPDYRTWPPPVRRPDPAVTGDLRRELADRAGFHTWVQWLVAEQAAAQRAARAAGMTIGIMHDLPVGAHPGGADAWAGQDVFVPGVSVGAPPDAFNPDGQDWSLPPWHPGHLAAQGYRPLAGLVGATARDAGGLRIDHALGLSRLWWIPAGFPPAAGAYVRYDHDAILGALAAELTRTGTIAVGEDLGTVEPGLRDALQTRGVLGTSVLWFESEPDGTPRPPSRWRRNSLASVGTHDMPPAAAFLTGAQIAERARHGLLSRPAAEERADADKMLRAWLAALTREGVLPVGETPDAGTCTAALYGYLARTPALLVSVSLADAAGELRSQNIPGTDAQYPNWRLPLCGPDGAPVLLEDLQRSCTVYTVALAAAGRAR
jgi:4-alpha-glucanotransferase